MTDSALLEHIAKLPHSRATFKQLVRELRTRIESREDLDSALDRLTERHEALTQTVELVAHLQIKNEEAIAKNEALMEKNQVLLSQVIESIDSLARIAHAHETRISDIEDSSK